MYDRKNCGCSRTYAGFVKLFNPLLLMMILLFSLYVYIQHHPENSVIHPNLSSVMLTIMNGTLNSKEGTDNVLAYKMCENRNCINNNKTCNIMWLCNASSLRYTTDNTFLAVTVLKPLILLDRHSLDDLIWYLLLSAAALGLLLNVINLFVGCFCDTNDCWGRSNNKLYPNEFDDLDRNEFIYTVSHVSS